MRNYTVPSSRLLLVIVLGASSYSLLGCSLFEPESHWKCFNPDCSPIDSGMSRTGTGGADGGSDAGTAGSSSSDSGGGGAGAPAGGDAGGACMACGADQVCDEVSRECVRCLGNDHCESAAPICTVDHRCVACTLDRHCPASAPACNDDNTCVGCTDSARHCGGETPLCDVTRHQCVQCLASSDCTDPKASRCSKGTCQPCTGPLHCEHLHDLGVCDASSGSGKCVQCTGTGYTACGADSVTSRPFICDSINRTCTHRTEASSGLCGKCVSDAECPAGQLCVLQEFESTTIGYFCMWRRGAGVAGAPSSCTTARPYFKTVTSAVSIDSTTADICTLAVSTCPAHADFRSPDVNCAPSGVPNDSLCGAPDVADAYCRPLPPPDGTVYRCTVPCLSSDDCQVGSDCDTLVTPRVCKF